MTKETLLMASAWLNIIMILLFSFVVYIITQTRQAFKALQGESARLSYNYEQFRYAMGEKEIYSETKINGLIKKCVQLQHDIVELETLNEVLKNKCNLQDEWYRSLQEKYKNRDADAKAAYLLWEEGKKNHAQLQQICDELYRQIDLLTPKDDPHKFPM